MSYAIVEAGPDAGIGFAPRGAAKQLWECRDHEVMIAGPAETGKTYAACQKLDALMWKYPGAQAVIARKFLTTVNGTVLQTFRKVLGAKSPVTTYGGEKPQWFDYPNGSRIWIAGLDNPGKALSSERDFVYVNQAEELMLGDWETLATRTTGRAGNAPYGQLMGDCNPGPPTHWIKHRTSLRLLESRHEDNPTLFDDAGRITDRGVATLKILDAITGVRKERLRYGKWVQAEGAVYADWDERIHLIDEMPAGWGSWRRLRSIDFGYTNPFVCQWWAVDGDGRMYLYREIYLTQTLVSVHASRIASLSEGERIEVTVSDHDAEDRATLETPEYRRDGTTRPGIPTIAATKDISPGIQAVQERLQKAGDGRPRLYVLRGALAHAPDPWLLERRRPSCTAEEFAVYSWPEGKDGKPVKEEPIDQDNHGMDAARYTAMRLGGGIPAQAHVAGRPIMPREVAHSIGAGPVARPAFRREVYPSARGVL